MKSRLGKKLAISMVLLALLCAGAMAQEVEITSASNVQMNKTTNLDLAIQHSNKDLGSVDITLEYDPSVMEVLQFEANSQVWMFMGDDLQKGRATISVGALGGRFVDARSPVLVGHFVVESMNDDGSQTPLGLVLEEITDSDVNKITTEFVGGIKNGSFSTLDEVPPMITITDPADGSTVSQTVNVAADSSMSVVSMRLH